MTKKKPNGLKPVKRVNGIKHYTKALLGIALPKKSSKLNTPIMNVSSEDRKDGDPVSVAFALSAFHNGNVSVNVTVENYVLQYNGRTPRAND